MRIEFWMMRQPDYVYSRCCTRDHAQEIDTFSQNEEKVVPRLQCSCKQVLDIRSGERREPVHYPLSQLRTGA